jgi:hypothetical protein
VVERIVGRWEASQRQAGAIEDPSQAAALLVWTLLSPLGSLPEGALVGPTSRAWYEELRLAPVVADALRGRGLDEGAAWWAAERVRTLLDLPLPSTVGGAAGSLPLRLVDAWLAHPAVRPFIRVNAWDGVEWFHRESWDELLAWMARLERILVPSGRPGARPAGRSALERKLANAAETAGYRVDLLRASLGASPGGAAASAAPELLSEPAVAAAPEVTVEPAPAIPPAPLPPDERGSGKGTKAKKKGTKADKGKKPRKAK